MSKIQGKQGMGTHMTARLLLADRHLNAAVKMMQLLIHAG